MLPQWSGSGTNKATVLLRRSHLSAGLPETAMANSAMSVLKVAEFTKRALWLGEQELFLHTRLTDFQDLKASEGNASVYQR